MKYPALRFLIARSRSPIEGEEGKRGKKRRGRFQKSLILSVGQRPKEGGKTVLAPETGQQHPDKRAGTLLDLCKFVNGLTGRSWRPEEKSSKRG